MAMDPFFLSDGMGGQRLGLYHAPRASGAGIRASVVYIAPFAEEMNKARRMAALQARAFAAAGCAVLQIDLLGCGDSSGDFGDASWSAWVDDVVRAAAWMRSRHPGSELWLWGLRVGCLLAAAAAGRIEGPCNHLYWQPTPSGKTALAQFLRLKAAAEVLDGGAKGVTAALRSELAAGRAVEIAGYALAPDLAFGLEQASLVAPPAAPGSRLEWLELAAAPVEPGRALPGLGPASLAAAARWREAGHAVRSRVVAGPSFWMTTEIEEAPELISASLAALEPVGPTPQPAAVSEAQAG